MLASFLVRKDPCDPSSNNMFASACKLALVTVAIAVFNRQTVFLVSCGEMKVVRAVVVAGVESGWSFFSVGVVLLQILV